MRPQEITSWLHAYHETAGTPERPYVESYVAIDDRPLLAEQGGEQLRGHFVHTRVSVGITDRAAQRKAACRKVPLPPSHLPARRRPHCWGRPPLACEEAPAARAHCRGNAARPTCGPAAAQGAGRGRLVHPHPAKWPNGCNGPMAPLAHWPRAARTWSRSHAP